MSDVSQQVEKNNRFCSFYKHSSYLWLCTAICLLCRPAGLREFVSSWLTAMPGPCTRPGRGGRAKIAPLSSRSSPPGAPPISVKVGWLAVPLWWILFLMTVYSCWFWHSATVSSPSVFDKYSKYSKVDVAKAIDLEMKGDIERCLTAIGKATFNFITLAFVKIWRTDLHIFLLNYPQWSAMEAGLHSLLKSST